MKKITLLIQTLLVAAGMNAQTIVGTAPEHKKVLIELLTGNYCATCHDAHDTINVLKHKYPNKVYAIAYTNASTYQHLDPHDWTTSFGTTFDNWLPCGAYPVCTVNRADFPSTISSAGSSPLTIYNMFGGFRAASNIVLADTAPMNIGMTAAIDVQTRVLTVNVEVYYTKNSAFASNKINVAILQNNLMGYQKYTEEGNTYLHQDVFRAYITPDWGDLIAQTTAGSLFTHTYTYTIPAKIKDIDMVLENLEVIGFVSQSDLPLPNRPTFGTGNKRDIGNVMQVQPTYTNAPNSNDAAINSILLNNMYCDGHISPQVEIENKGSNVLQNLHITYATSAGVSQTYNWTGNLATYKRDTVSLPAIQMGNYTGDSLVVNVQNPNGASDPTSTDNRSSLDSIVKHNSYSATALVKLNIRTDNDSQWDDFWRIENASGAIISSGGNYWGNSNNNKNITLPSMGCYKLIFWDAKGNGFSGVAGKGYTLTDNIGDTIVNSSFGSTVRREESIFSYGLTTGISNTLTGKLNVSVYPNPGTGILNISQEGQNIDAVCVYNTIGELVCRYINKNSGNISINLSSLDNGVYFISFYSGTQVETQKIVISK